MCGLFHEPLQGSLLSNQYFMESKTFFCGSLGQPRLPILKQNILLMAKIQLLHLLSSVVYPVICKVLCIQQVFVWNLFHQLTIPIWMISMKAMS